MRTSDLVRLAGTGLRYVGLTRILHRSVPLVGGIAINDSCNLHCVQCGVSNRGIADMSIAEVRQGLSRLRALGIRVLYIEGGEPFMWRDEERDLDDVVALARKLGFVAIIIYTNGTFPIHTRADTVYVSLDGLRDTNDGLRGRSYERALANINASDHPNIQVNFTVNRQNEPEIESFCSQMSAIPHVKGIFFYFVTPTQTNSPLLLSNGERASITRRLLALKRAGAPVRNSAAALRSVLDNTWGRPTSLCYLYANRTMYRCCRSVDDAAACEQCGYLGYAELDCIARLRFGAVREAFGAMAGHP